MTGTLTDSYAQPASFAWEVDPSKTYAHIEDMHALIKACAPLCDWIYPWDGRDALPQLRDHAHFFATDLMINQEGFLKRGPLEIAPLMRLFWKDETVLLYGAGYVAIVGKGAASVLRKE